MQLQLSTWQEVEAYLNQSRGIVLPIGSTEQHGPVGLIGTDAICAEAVAAAVGEETGAMVGPVINVGMAQHHMAFPGSVTYRPTTLVLVIRDIVQSLAEHGFERFLFVNGHGGNDASITAAFYEIYAEARALRGADAPPLRFKRVNWWQTEDVKALAKEAFGDAEGTHATASEVALAQFVHPDHIKTVPLDPPIAPSRRSFYDCRHFRREFPDGRIGSNSALATPQLGERFLRTAVSRISEIYGEFLAEP